MSGLTPLRKRVRDASKDYSLPATVVDAVGSRCSVRLAQNGQLMTGLRYSGVKPEPGKKVQVDFISGTPIVLTGAGQAAAPEPQPIPASPVNSEQVEPDYSGILRYHGGTLMAAYPADEDGMQDALDDCNPDDVIVLPAIELTMDVVMPDEITIKGESKETSFIYGRVSLGANCKVTLVTILNSKTDDANDVVALANEGTTGQSTVSFCNIHASNCGTVKLGIGYLSEHGGNIRISSCYLTGEDNLSADGGICASRSAGYVYIENSTLYGSFTGDVHVYNNYVDPEYVDACPPPEPPPLPLPEAFGKTSPLNGASGVLTSLTLSWEESENGVYYEYYLDKSPTGGAWTSTGGAIWKDITGLDYESTYYWQVRAGNDTGTTEADSGTKWTFTTETEGGGGTSGNGYDYMVEGDIYQDTEHSGIPWEVVNNHSFASHNTEENYPPPNHYALPSYCLFTIKVPVFPDHPAGGFLFEFERMDADSDPLHYATISIGPYKPSVAQPFPEAHEPNLLLDADWPPHSWVQQHTYFGLETYTLDSMRNMLYIPGYCSFFVQVSCPSPYAVGEYVPQFRLRRIWYGMTLGDLFLLYDCLGYEE